VSSCLGREDDAEGPDIESLPRRSLLPKISLATQYTRKGCFMYMELLFTSVKQLNTVVPNHIKQELRSSGMLHGVD
jgi:hypothetical protein